MKSFDQSQIQKVCDFSPALTRFKAEPGNDSLTILRNQNWTQCLLESYFHPENLQSACAQWSQTADDIILQTCPRFFNPDKIAVFAFGKLGSKELNLSSDIDLLIVAKSVDEEDVRAARKFQLHLSGVGQGSLLFRVDYELRPGGRTGPLISTIEQLMDYYGTYGEVWERLAFIRLRPIWGQPDVIKSVMDFRERFSFRRHLDYRLLEDLNALREKVHRLSKQNSKPGQTDLKLAPGGIRDVELFCHALQVIHGGKLKDLRLGDTTSALQKMQDFQILKSEDVQFLLRHYWDLRRAENLVQGVEDQQTHHISDEQIDFLNYTHLQKTMTKAAKIVDSLLGKVKSLDDSFPMEHPLQLQWFSENGFSDSEVHENWQDVTLIPVLSRDRERDLAARQKFLHALLKSMASDKNHYSQKRLSYLQDFLRSIRSKTAFFSLFLNRENLVDLFAQILNSSPRLSRILISRPELLDSILFQTTENVSPSEDWDVFLEMLSEQKALTEFLAGARFLADKNLPAFTHKMTALADHIVLAVLQKSELLNSQKSNVSILALGKWGGEEIGMSSDLDSVFLTEHAVSEQEVRKLRRVLNQLASPQKSGLLYQVDSRLRPTDQGGVLISSRVDFLDFLQNKAEPWQRQVYLKSRVLGSDLVSAKEIREVCISKGLTADELVELERIRVELLKNKPKAFDIKHAEGGLLDVELAVQTAVLKEQVLPEKADLESMITALTNRNSAWSQSGPALILSYNNLRVWDQKVRLQIDEVQPNFDNQPHEVRAQIEHTLIQQIEILKKLDPRRSCR